MFYESWMRFLLLLSYRSKAPEDCLRGRLRVRPFRKPRPAAAAAHQPSVAKGPNSLFANTAPDLNVPMDIFDEDPDDEPDQVWSLSTFNVSRQVLKVDLNQLWSVSLLMTSLTALTNEGLFELNSH